MKTFGSGVAVGVVVGLAVPVAVAVNVGVAIAVPVAVAVAVAVLLGTAVAVAVGAGVRVLVAVAAVVAVALAVGVAGSAVAVGVSVLGGVSVAVGETKVIAPFAVVGATGRPAVSDRVTRANVSSDLPVATVPNLRAVSTPRPLGPGPSPVVLQPNVMLSNATATTSTLGAEQTTVRPVEPTNASLLMLMNVSSEASHVSVKS